MIFFRSRLNINTVFSKRGADGNIRRGSGFRVCSISGICGPFKRDRNLCGSTGFQGNEGGITVDTETDSGRVSYDETGTAPDISVGAAFSAVGFRVHGDPAFVSLESG